LGFHKKTLIGITSAEFSLSIEQNFGVLQDTVTKIIKPSKVAFGYKVYYVTRKDLPGQDKLNITYQIRIQNEYTLARASAFKLCANATATLRNAVRQRKFNSVLASYALTDSMTMRGVTSNGVSFSTCNYVTPESETSTTTSNKNNAVTIGIVLGTLMGIFMIIFIVLGCWFTRKTLLPGIDRWGDFFSSSRRYFPMLHPSRVAVVEATIATSTNATANTTVALAAPPVAEVISAEPLRRNRYMGSALPSAAAVNVVNVSSDVVAAEVELV
jgi:hypothetical protein